jgi:hypothetical protein
MFPVGRKCRLGDEDGLLAQAHGQYSLHGHRAHNRLGKGCPVMALLFSK